MTVLNQRSMPATVFHGSSHPLTITGGVRYLPRTGMTNIDPFMIRVDANQEVTINASTPSIPLNEEFYLSLYFAATGEFNNTILTPAIDQPTEPFQLHGGNWIVTVTDDEITGKLRILLENEPDR